jgi:hypothetical protein
VNVPVLENDWSKVRAFQKKLFIAASRRQLIIMPFYNIDCMQMSDNLRDLYKVFRSSPSSRRPFWKDW